MRTLMLVSTCAMIVGACAQQNRTEAKDDKTRPAEKGSSGASKSAEAPPSKAEPTDRFAAPTDVAAPPQDAETTSSGLAYRFLKESESGTQPGPNDQVTVHYTGWTTDGKMFDSSHKRGRPASFGLNQVIAGWTEGLQLMKVGDQARLWIPEPLAYQGNPGKPQGMLVFDVELLDVKAAPKVPENVAAPPKEAKTTESGLAYLELESGSGKKPGPTDRVRVHYSGWTTDGKMFDSSKVRGKPAEFPLNGVIKGWTEGLQLMPEGSTYRLWIPSELAYGNRPGRPQGMLVFDVELLKVL